MSDERITEEWLRSSGFRWEQLERQPSKQWLLWLAGACIDPRERSGIMFACDTDLGIELAHDDVADVWYCWLRADYAGRYCRFLHIRHMTLQREVVQLIEAITGRPWSPADALYGSLRAPKYAEYLRSERQRLDHDMAHDWGKRVERELNLDPDKRETVRP